MILPCMAISQVQVIEFNANWNEANSVKWLSDLTDCKTKKIDHEDNRISKLVKKLSE